MTRRARRRGRAGSAPPRSARARCARRAARRSGERSRRARGRRSAAAARPASRGGGRSRSRCRRRARGSRRPGRCCGRRPRGRWSHGAGSTRPRPRPPLRSASPSLDASSTTITSSASSAASRRAIERSRTGITTLTGGRSPSGGSGCARLHMTSVRASAPPSPTGSPARHASIRRAASSPTRVIANGSPPRVTGPSTRRRNVAGSIAGRSVTFRAGWCSTSSPRAR